MLTHIHEFLFHIVLYTLISISLNKYLEVKNWMFQSEGYLCYENEDKPDRLDLPSEGSNTASGSPHRTDQYTGRIPFKCRHRDGWGTTGRSDHPCSSHRGFQEINPKRVTCH